MGRAAGYIYSALFFASAAIISAGILGAQSTGTSAFHAASMTTFSNPGPSICNYSTSEIQSLSYSQVSAILNGVTVTQVSVPCVNRFVENLTTTQINHINASVLSNILDNYVAYSNDEIATYGSDITSNVSSVNVSLSSTSNISLSTAGLLAVLRNHIDLNANTISQLLLQQSYVTSVESVPMSVIVDMLKNGNSMTIGDVASNILAYEPSLIYGIPKETLAKLLENSTSLNTQDLISLIEANAPPTIAGIPVQQLIQVLQSYNYNSKGPVEESLIENMPPQISVDGITVPTRPLLQLIENGSTLNTSTIESLLEANLPSTNIYGIPLPTLVQILGSNNKNLTNATLEYMLESQVPSVMSIPTYTLVQLMRHRIDLKNATIESLLAQNLPQNLVPGFRTNELLWDWENNNLPSSVTIEERLLTYAYLPYLHQIPASTLIGILNQSLPLNTSTIEGIIGDIDPSLLEFLPNSTVIELINNPGLLFSNDSISGQLFDQYLFHYIDPITVYNIPAPVLFNFITNPRTINDQTLLNYVLPSLAPDTIAGVPTWYVAYILENPSILRDPYTIENLMSYVAPSVVQYIPPDVMYTLLTHPDRLNTTSLSNIFLYIAPSTIGGIPSQTIVNLFQSMITGHPPLGEVFPLSLNNLLYYIPSRDLGGLSPIQVSNIFNIISHNFTLSIPTLQNLLSDLPQSGLTTQLQMFISVVSLFTAHNKPIIMSADTGGLAHGPLGSVLSGISTASNYMSMVQGIATIFGGRGFTLHVISSGATNYTYPLSLRFAAPDAAYGLGSLRNSTTINDAINSGQIPINASPVPYILNSGNIISSYIHETTPSVYSPLSNSVNANIINGTSGSLSWSAINYTYEKGSNATSLMYASFVNNTLFNLTEGGRLAHAYVLSRLANKTVTLEKESLMEINSQMSGNLSIVAYVPRNITIYWNGSSALVSISRTINNSASVNLSSTGLQIKGINFSLKKGLNASLLDLYNPSISITSSNATNSSVYVYIDINSSINDSYVKNTTYTFEVSKDWIASHGADPSGISLYVTNKSTGMWSAINTSIIGNSSAAYLYAAVSKGFSTYAIGTAPPPNGIMPVANSTITTTVQIQATSTAVNPTQHNASIATYTAAVIAVIVIILLAYYLLRRRN